MEEIIISIFAGLSVAALVFTFFGKTSPPKKEGDPKEIDAVLVDENSTLKKSLQKVPSMAGIMNKRLHLNKIEKSHPYHKLRTFLDKMLTRAGHPNNLNCDDLINACFYSCIISVVLASLYASSSGGNVLMYCYLSFAFGLGLPILILNVAATKRQAAIRKDLPYLIDLLTLCIEAGMDFTTAMIRVIPVFNGTALGVEVSLLVTELRMGKTRIEGLHDLSQRVGLIELSLIVNAIVQADKLGTSLAPTLRIQSDDIRKHRSLMAEELAMKAPVKMLFPIVIFIFPTTFIVLFAPMVLKLL
jgi:tight adherence protein C